MDELNELMSWGRQGYTCSQMLMLKSLALQGREAPESVRLMTGFAGGIGWTGDLCGILTGAVAVLSLYAGKGTIDEENDPRLLFMIDDLKRWFTEKYGDSNGGIRCDQILGNNAAQMDLQRCAEMILETFQFLKEMLIENGFDLSGDFEDD